MPHSPISTNRRRNHNSFYKQLHQLLGPKLATPLNFLVLVSAIELLVIVFLAFTIIAKNNALRRAEALSEFTETQIAHPPLHFDHPVPQAVEDARYDDMSPAITGYANPIKYTTFLGNFLRCKPRPCDIDHWSYLGEKCFYRNHNVKDRVAHNASIWSLVQNHWYYSVHNDFACPVSVCRNQWHRELNLTSQIVLRALIDHFGNTSTAWNVDRMFFGNKYVRLNQFWGIEYQLNGGFSLTTVGEAGLESVEHRNASITIRRGFTHKFCDVSLYANVLPATNPIYIIVPYVGRLQQLRLFYQNIKHLVDSGVILKLIISTHGGPVHMLAASELLRDMQNGLTEGDLADGHPVQIVPAAGDRHGNFSRSSALVEGMQYVPAEALVFMCDVDIIIKKQFFDNCRHNTHRNYQVYYPVVYSLYPYGREVSKEHGYWRKGAFGMLCVYKSDYKRTFAWTGWKQKKIMGWGVEDVQLHKDFSNHWQISVFHAVEPNLLHRWHPKYCQFNANVAACLGTVFQNMGSQKFLAAIVASRAVDVRKVEYSPVPVDFSDYKNGTGGSEKGKLEMPEGESEVSQTKMEELKIAYESSLFSGREGLLSIFAKEAVDIFEHASAHSNVRKH